MGEIEGDADRGLVGGGEPLVGEEALRTERQVAIADLGVQLSDPPLEGRALDLDVEVADPDGEKILVGKVFPRDPRRTGGIRAQGVVSVSGVGSVGSTILTRAAAHSRRFPRAARRRASSASGSKAGASQTRSRQT